MVNHERSPLQRSPKSPRIVLKAILLLTAMLLAASGILVQHSQAATPSSGSLSQTSLALSWQGAFYAFGVNADPSQCPPAADPLNLICDHFFITLDLPSNFWQTHTGAVTVTIQWPSSAQQNDFDLFIYRTSDGAQVGSSTAGGGETQEQVALQNPLPGVYEARTTPFLVIDSAYTGSANLTFTNGATTNPTFPTGGISFGPATIVDSQRTEGEPLNHIDKNGNIWESGPWGASTGQGFVAKSTDKGDSFHNVAPNGLRPNPSAVGGGDSDILTDDQGNVYFADLEDLVDVAVAVSNDGGNTWRSNPLTFPVPGDDRQWLAIDDGLTPSAMDNTVFLVANGEAFGWTVLSSPGSTGFTDPVGGLVYQNAATTTTGAITTDPRCGRLLFDPVNRILYLPCNKGDHEEIWKASVAPGQRTGLHFTSTQVPTSPGGQIGLGHLFSDIAVDKAGNIYAVWIDVNNNNVYLSASTNQGGTWTAPVQVNGNPANSNVMPWAIAGNRGIVDIAFYGTSTQGDPNTFPNWLVNRQAAANVKWFTYLVQVQNATSTTPTIYQVPASEHPTDYGQICTGGLGCTTSMGDRTLADFFTLAIDSDGAARIVINDLSNQHHGAALFELTQVSGPSAYGTTLTLKSPNIISGVTDPTGDAQVPHYAPSGAGPNQPALDLTSIQLSQPDSSHLTVTLKLQSLASILPPAGTTGLLWLTRWQFNTTGDGGEQSFRIFYLGANSTAGQTPVFFAGTGTSAAPGTGIPPGDGCITTSPQNCKILVYPAEKTETGTFNPATNTITITAPLADIGSPLTNDELISVTALTYAFTNGNPIMMDADATRAFDFSIGKTITPSNCPLGTACKVTGGGYIFTDPQQDHGSFSIDVTVDSSGRIHGKAAYVDQDTGLSFRTNLITSANFNGNTATITGTGTANGVATTFMIAVQDNAEPGAGADTFSIQLGTAYSKSGTLQGGNIQIH